MSSMDSMMETFVKYFLITYYALFFLFAMCLPIYRVWKTTGVNPYRLGSTDSAHDYIGKLFRILLIVCAFVIFSFVVFPSIYNQFLPISFLSSYPISGIGMILLIFAVVWVLAAQGHMQKSWRIGIDEDIKTKLVQRGLFRISRNPIFLGMRLMLLGLFLVLPNAVTLVILVSGEILMQVQVRLEEEFLTRVHGDRYRMYQAQVRRWI